MARLTNVACVTGRLNNANDFGRQLFDKATKEVAASLERSESYESRSVINQHNQRLCEFEALPV